MDEISIKIEINNDISKVNIQGLPDNPLEIDFSGDVDFTELVSALTKLVDDSKRVVLEKIDSVGDEKLKLIVETISSIFEKYNEAILKTDVTDESEDEDLPF